MRPNCGREGSVQSKRKHKRKKTQNFPQNNLYQSRILKVAILACICTLAYICILLAYICIYWALGLGLGLTLTLIPKRPVAMATYCLLPLWLVVRSNKNSSHCFNALGGVFSEFQSVLRFSGSWTIKKVRVTHWTSEKTPPRALTNVKILNIILMTATANDELSLLLYFHESASKSQLQGPDEWKTRKRHHSDANRQQMLVKAYTRYRWRVNGLTNLGLEEIFAEFRWRKLLPIAVLQL